MRCGACLQNGGSDLAISESYIRGDLDLEGDLEAAMPLATYLAGRQWPISTMLQVGWNLFRMSANGRSDRNGQRPATLYQVTFIRSSEIGKR